MPGRRQRTLCLGSLVAVTTMMRFLFYSRGNKGTVVINLPQITQVVELGLAESACFPEPAVTLDFSALIGCPVLSTFQRQL